MDSKIYIQTHLNNTFIELNQPNKRFESMDDFLSTQEDKSTYVLYNVNEPHELTNIDDLQRFFCEYCSMYYVWKNQIKSDIVTFCHYRRLVENNTIYKTIKANDFKEDYIYFYRMMWVKIGRFREKYNIPFDNLTKLENKYKYIYTLLYSLNLPKHISEDILYFYDTIGWNYMDLDKIHIDSLDDLDCIIFPNRSLFTLYWDKFNLLIEHIEKLIQFIFNKYNISYDISILKPWYMDTFIKYLQHNTDFNRIQYVEEKYYNEIYNIKTDFGYTAIYNNSWRLFSYIIEIMIGIYILCNNNYHISLKSINDIKKFKI